MNKRLIHLQLTVTIVSSLVWLTSGPVMAQTSPTNQPLQDLELEDPNDPNQVFTDRGGAGSLLNFINRLQQVNGRSSGEFAEDQADSFDSAVEAFRQKQQQREGTTPSSVESNNTNPAIEKNP